MRLKLDKNITYAVALEGGGAKGAYEIGVWQALEKAGIRYNAVSGASVGALNGALMAMRDLDRAVEVWRDVELTNVFALDEDEETLLEKAFNGDIDMGDIQQLLYQTIEIIRNRGLDVSPLRSWVRQVVDEEKIRSSDVELFVSTLSLTDRKALTLRLNDLAPGEICDMLLASAYHPSFRLEKLGGKLYADGGLVDNLPMGVLAENGYKHIIAVRLPDNGKERKYKTPEGTQVTFIDTFTDLGGTLNFNAEQARQNMEAGYFDAMRVLYGLYGRKYYIDRSLSDREALNWFLDHDDSGSSLRQLCEKELPRMAKKLDVDDGDYYLLLLAYLESQASELGIKPMAIYSDEELMESIASAKLVREPALNTY